MSPLTSRQFALLLTLSFAGVVCNAQSDSLPVPNANEPITTAQVAESQPTTAATETALEATQMSTEASLFPPDSPEPAAGICEPWPGAVVPVPIVDLSVEGAPSPRCIQVVGEQVAEFINRTSTVVTVHLGPMGIVLQPEEAHRQQVALGAFLALGAHVPRLEAEDGSLLGSPTLWLVER